MVPPRFIAMDPGGSLAQGGVLIVVNGGGFRLPPDPDPVGELGGMFPRTVRVEIDGVAAGDVRVWSSEVLSFIAPGYAGDPDAAALDPVAVRIVNLNDAGLEIAGEDVEVLDAFQYLRPALDGTSDFTRLVRELLRLMKRHVMRNVNMTVHTDYDDTVSDGLNIIKFAEVPGIVITGPELRTNRFYSVNSTEPRNVIGIEYRRRRPPRTVDLVFGLVGMAEHQVVLLNMMAAVVSFFEQTQDIVILCDPDDPSAGTLSYEFKLTEDPAAVSQTNNDNLRQFDGAFEIIGFDIQLGDVERTFALAANDGAVELDLQTGG